MRNMERTTVVKVRATRRMREASIARHRGLARLCSMISIQAVESPR
jgi:hypothetical protein